MGRCPFGHAANLRELAPGRSSRGKPLARKAAASRRTPRAAPRQKANDAHAIVAEVRDNALLLFQFSSATIQESGMSLLTLYSPFFVARRA